MASIKTSMLSKFAMLCTAFNTVRNTICHTKLHIELEVRLSSFNRSRQLKLLFYFHNELRDRTKYNTKKLCIVSKAMDNKVALSVTSPAANLCCLIYKYKLKYLHGSSQWLISFVKYQQFLQRTGHPFVYRDIFE